MIFGQPTFAYESVSSTQTAALDLARSGWPPGTVVTARSQTAGRGRHGAHWYSPPGANVNLTAIGEAIEPENLWQLSVVAGVAVAETARRLAPKADVRVRFPNDILVRGRKLAGVLVETTRFDGDLLPLIGIGINVVAGQFPLEIASRAIALQEVTGTASIAVDQVELLLLERLSVQWRVWQGGANFAATAKAWNSLLATDAERSFVLDGEEVTATVQSLDTDGIVYLKRRDGVEVAITAASVVLGDG